jgi:small subunit ribosomal protein S3
MGHKVHPTGFRLPVTKAWTSRWYAEGTEYSQMLTDDLRVREYLRRKLKTASVGKVLIERPAKNARITIYSARPGVVIGKKGEDIEQLKVDLQRMMGVPVHVNIEEIRKPETDAQLVADSITQQLERRIMFRRAMKRAMQNAMRLGAQGIKIKCAGRLNGAEIARSEWYREGRVPLHTLRASIDYGVSEAITTYGIIGVKVWVYHGDRLANGEAPAQPERDEKDDRRNRRGPRQNRDSRGPRREGAGGARGSGAGGGKAPAPAAAADSKPAAEQAAPAQAPAESPAAKPAGEAKE